MAIASRHSEPADAAARRAVEPVLVYALDRLPPLDQTFYETVRGELSLVEEFTVPARDARVFEVPAGHLFRIVTAEGSQVGDLNLQRQDTCPARHPREHRRPAVEQLAVAAPHGDHYPRYPGVVRH